MWYSAWEPEKDQGLWPFQRYCRFGSDEIRSTNTPTPQLCADPELGTAVDQMWSLPSICGAKWTHNQIGKSVMLYLSGFGNAREVPHPAWKRIREGFQEEVTMPED